MSAPTIYNVTLTDADTEYSQAITGPQAKIIVQATGVGIIRIAFVTGKVATPTAPYYSIKSGDVLQLDFSDRQPTDNFTIFLASPTATTVAEILVYSN